MIRCVVSQILDNGDAIFEGKPFHFGQEVEIDLIRFDDLAANIIPRRIEKPELGERVCYKRGYYARNLRQTEQGAKCNRQNDSHTDSGPNADKYTCENRKSDTKCVLVLGEHAIVVDSTQSFNLRFLSSFGQSMQHAHTEVKDSKNLQVKALFSTFRP